MNARNKLPAAVQRKIADWYRNRELTAASVEWEEKQEKRRRCRQRLYECSECGKKLRAADDYLQVIHRHVDPETMEETYHPFVLQTPVLDSPKARGHLDVVPF